MIRVLVADDHSIFREGLSELLASAEGIEVAGEARDGAEAVGLAKSLRPDVMVLDLSMPGVDGFEVIRRVVSECIPVRILVLTMHKDASGIRRALDLGADGYLLKEEAFEELARGIRAVAGGARFLSPPVRAACNRLDGEAIREELTPREREVVTRIAAGKSTREIAAELGIGVKTVETHRQHVMEKLGFRKSAQIAVYAAREGLVD
jgi:DNA-binding NarL/FixJ family response regulator